MVINFKSPFSTAWVQTLQNSILLTVMSAIWLVFAAGILVVVLLLELNALPNIRFQGSGCVTAVQSE